MSNNVQRLGRTLARRMQITASAAVGTYTELGSIHDNLSLTTDSLQVAIPKGDYMFMREHVVQAGDRVLVVWCGNEPVVAGVVTTVEQPQEEVPTTEEVQAMIDSAIDSAIEPIEQKIATKYIQTGSVDLNNYTESGLYVFSTGATIANIPAGVNGCLVVISPDGYSDDFIKQLWFRWGTNNANDAQTYVRTWNGTSGTWSSWTQYTTASQTSTAESE